MDEDEIEARLAEIDNRNGDLYQRVGMLCTLFSGLETQLRDIVKLIEDAHNLPMEERLPADEQYGKTVERMKSLTRAFLRDETQTVVAPIITRLKQVGKKRNDIVHSSWNATSGDLFHQERVRPRAVDPQSQEHATAPSFIATVTEESADLIFELECLRRERLKYD